MRKRTGENVDSDRLATLRLKGTDQRLAEMAGTAGHQNCHAAITFVLLARSGTLIPVARIDPVEFSQ